MELLAGIKQDENGKFYHLARTSTGELVRVDCDPPVDFKIVNPVVVTGPDGQYVGGFLHGLNIVRVR